MAQKRKPTPQRAPRTRILRIGIIQGGRIIEERLVREHKDVSVGQGPRNSFVISSENLPRTYQVFKVDKNDKYTLNFAAGMDGRVTVGGGVRTLSQARDMGAAKKAGDWWHLPLEGNARGKLVIGDVTLLFQFVQAPPVVPRARLPATIQGSVGSRMDPAFTMVMAGCVALAAAFWITVQVVPKPTKPERPKRFQQLVKSELKRTHRKPPRPRKTTQVADVKKGKEGEDAGKGASKPAPRPRPGKGDGKGKGKNKGPLKKGTEEYKQRLTELTNISLRKGSDRMNAVAIAGKCTGADCENAIQGPDHLRKGLSTGGLDNAAATASRTGSGGLGSGGPKSGTGGRRGLVGKGGKGRIGAGGGVGTGGGGGAAASMKPMRVKKIKSRVSSFVPPPRVGGSAGSRVRAKIRGRVYTLRSCYNRALINNPKLSGSVKISFIIMPNGRVSNVNVISGMGGSLVSCIKGRVRRWHLGKVPNKIFYGPFSVRFTPGG
jgi:hypothetical protein